MYQRIKSSKILPISILLLISSGLFPEGCKRQQAHPEKVVERFFSAASRCDKNVMHKVLSKGVQRGLEAALKAAAILLGNVNSLDPLELICRAYKKGKWTTERVTKQGKRYIIKGHTQKEHLTFEVEERDGTYIITAVSSKVWRISEKGVKEIPAPQGGNSKK